MSIGMQLYHAASRLTSSYTEIFSFTLGFIFSAFVFGLIIDFKFSVAFILSCGLTVLINRVVKNKLGVQADENKKMEVKFFETIDRAWDNVLLDNPTVKGLYCSKYKNDKQAFLRSTKSMFTFSEFIVFVSSLLAWLPVIVVDLNKVPDRYKSFSEFDGSCSTPSADY